MAGGVRRGAGRKRIEIDLGEWERLFMLHCSTEEVAAYLGVSVRTIASRLKQPQFAEVMARGKAKGRISVRRAQMKLLEAGNAAMAIWLGKQMLGQRDATPVELSGPHGQPLQITLQAIDEIVTRAKKRTTNSSGH